MNLVDSAIITAAGFGTRLEDLTADRPKALVEAWDGEALILRLARQFEQVGIINLTVVIGYRGEMIREALGERLGAMRIRFVEAANYAHTNNITSLAAVPAMDRPVVIADCDVLASAIPRRWLSFADHGVTIPVRQAHAGETGAMVRLGDWGAAQLQVVRESGDVRSTDRKSLSLYVLNSPHVTTAFFARVATLVDRGRTRLYYEDALVELSAEGIPIHPVPAEADDVTAFEIDTKAELAAAQEWTLRQQANEAARRIGNA